MKLTKKQIEQLSQFEDNFKYAKADVLIGITSNDYAKLVEVYNQATGQHEAPTVCPSCRLRIMKKLATIYDETKQEEHEQDNRVPEKVGKETKRSKSRNDI